MRRHSFDSPNNSVTIYHYPNFMIGVEIEDQIYGLQSLPQAVTQFASELCSEWWHCHFSIPALD